jgi:hypothetical protein
MVEPTSQFYTDNFYDRHSLGSLNSARAVLTEVKSMLPFGSVADIGSGVAAWSRAAVDLGAGVVAAVDGNYVPRADLLIDEANFHPWDLETFGFAESLSALGKFDLAMSLEVAEHLSHERAESFVAGLSSLSDAVLFSAAVPGQGGVNHINEQWPSYWAPLFQGRGFYCFDVLRTRIWDRPDVDWWYAQNVMLYVREGSSAFEEMRSRAGPTPVPPSFVHPRMHRNALDWATWPLNQRVEQLERQVETMREALKAVSGKLHAAASAADAASTG